MLAAFLLAACALGLSSEDLPAAPTPSETPSVEEVWVEAAKGDGRFDSRDDIRRPEDVVDEQLVVDGKTVVRPWRPRFVFHGSGAIHKAVTGCIACPCDSPGGLIADVTTPIDEPRPTAKFNWLEAPPEGTNDVVLIHPAPVRAKSP